MCRQGRLRSVQSLPEPLVLSHKNMDVDGDECKKLKPLGVLASCIYM